MFSELRVVEFGHHLNHDIQRREVLCSLSKVVTNNPFDPIAFVGFLNPTLTDNQTEAGGVHSISNGRHT